MAGAVNINVRGSMERVIAEQRRATRAVRDVAVPRALNKMIDQVTTASAREIRATGYKLKISDIKKGLRKSRATSTSLTARVTASGKPIALQAYGARQTAKGVSVDVLNGRKVVTHAFIATMPNGHKHVLVRIGKTHKKRRKGDGTQWSGLPIKALFGPSVPDGLANAAVQEALQRLVTEKFPAIVRQQMDRLT